MALETYVKNVLSKALPFLRSHVKHRWQFKNKIENTVIPDNHCMISSDATSLFKKYFHKISSQQS